MTQAEDLLCAAGNVEVPAYLVLRQKDYIITASGNEGWQAERGKLRFQANNLIELLGLVGVYEARGASWAAGNEEIDEFLAKYDL